MRVDAGEEENMMEWMMCIYLNIRYALCVICVFDKHLSMFCVTGIGLVKRI